MNILEVNNVTKRFGGITAVEKVSISIKAGEIYGLIGPNGSGKTTLLNLISGIHKPDEGLIYFDGFKLNFLPPYDKRFRKMTRTFQIPKLWKKLDVFTNLLVAGYGKSPSANKETLKEKAYYILDFLDMNHLARVPASKLSGGQAKLLEFGRALMSDAKLILLDEPFAGVSPALIHKQIELILTLRKEKNTAFLIISHIISTVVALADKIGVMSNGRLIAEGKAEEVLSSRSVIEAYLGGFGVY